jgi:RimJ/RimL family protein N-acetyltransferase
MSLIPLDRPELLDSAAAWLGDECNYRWLAFGRGVQRIGPVTLRTMVQRPIHLIRAFVARDGTPIGLVALSDIDRAFRTASLWMVLGDKRYARRGYTRAACAAMLTLGFRELALGAVSAWTVECNRASIGVLRSLNFRPAGRLRACHTIGGRSYDRLLFDIVADEHLERVNARNTG